MRDQVNDLDGTPWYMWHMWLCPVVGPIDAERGREVRGPRGGGSNLKGCQDYSYSWNSRVQKIDQLKLYKKSGHGHPRSGQKAQGGVVVKIAAIIDV